MHIKVKTMLPSIIKICTVETHTHTYINIYIYIISTITVYNSNPATM